MNNFYNYLLLCSDGSYYSGWTTNVKDRVKEHNNGTGGKYTRSRRPVTLAAFWNWNSKSEAMKAEAYVKTMRREQKQKLAAGTLNLVLESGRISTVVVFPGDVRILPAQTRSNSSGEE